MRDIYEQASCWEQSASSMRDWNREDAVALRLDPVAAEVADLGRDARFDRVIEAALLRQLSG